MDRADSKHGLIPEGSGSTVFIAGVLIVSMLVGLIVWINHKRPYWATERILDEQIHWCYKNRSELPEEKELDVVDGWGNQLIYGRHVEPKIIVHGVLSKGPDGVRNTDDDIIGYMVVVNKSKIIGEWLGQKGKQVVGGIKEGIKKPSEFEEEEKTKKKWWKFGKKTANPED